LGQGAWRVYGRIGVRYPLHLLEWLLVSSYIVWNIYWIGKAEVSATNVGLYTWVGRYYDFSSSDWMENLLFSFHFEDVYGTFDRYDMQLNHEFP
jgi:hypothetical protein